MANFYINKSIYEIKNLHTEDIYVSTCKSPINIALIKYWGKIDEDLIIPVNNSLSLTLNIDDMYTKTTIAFSSKFHKDKLYVNGSSVDLADQKNKKAYRINKILNIFRSSIYWKLLNIPESNFYFHINSYNNFPTSAGLASSSSGFSAIAVCLARLFKKPTKGKVEASAIQKLSEVYTTAEIVEISDISRLGSGSSCRSLFGGFAKWVNKKEGENIKSIAMPIPSTKPSNLLENLVLMILVTNSAQKLVGSTEGMRRSIKTSELLKYRINNIVQVHMERMEGCINELEKNINEVNFSEFCKLIIQESNQLQAICRDSYPPIIYTNQTSDTLIDFVVMYNELYAKFKQNEDLLQVAYSFDAGPNAFIFMPKNHVKPFFELLRHSIDIRSFDSKKIEEIENDGINLGYGDHCKDEWIKYIKQNLDKFHFSQHLVIDNVFCTTPGHGPIYLNDISDSLIDKEGKPIMNTNHNNNHNDH